MKALFSRAFDEDQLLSPHGIRSVSRAHHEHPFQMTLAGEDLRVDYEPGESHTRLFGGNSNWRGPVWFPINYLILESMLKFHHYYGDDFTIEFPSGSRTMVPIKGAANQLRMRLASLFLKDPDGHRPIFGNTTLFNDNPHFQDLIPFHEYFHGDTGRGCGAFHQTGWTGLIAKIMDPMTVDEAKADLLAR